MKRNFIKLSAYFTLVTSFAMAQEQNLSKTIQEIVISDTKFAQSKEKSGKIIEKITAKDLENKKGQSLANVLSQVAGVEVNGNQSGTGKNLAYYIRGGRSRQVLIVIDGVPVTDASGIGLQYDLRLLPVEQIESIEIMKGAASTLYGSGAATGLINISLKKAVKKEIEGTAYINLGTQNVANQTKTSAQDFNQGFSVNGTKGRFSYLTSLNSTETKGISEAAGTNFETDNFSRVNIMQKIGVDFNSKINFQAFANYDRLKSAFDGGSFSDEVANISFSEQFRVGFTTKYKYVKGELNFVTGYTNLERKYDTYSSWTSSVDYSYYKSRSMNADLFNKYNFSKQVFLILGTQFQFMDMLEESAFESITNTQANFNVFDPYATLVYYSNFGLNINAGARINNHNVYGNYTTFNFNPSFNFKTMPLKLISSYSTAYITPSLYQLYSPYGNLKLKPEENTTIEAGFETNLFQNKISFNAVGFYREEENSYDFFTDEVTYESKYINNSSQVIAKGVETNLGFKPVSYLSINGNYTFTQVAEAQSKLIPKHKVNVSFDVDLAKKMHWNTQYQYVESRNDAFFDSNTFATVNNVLASYQILNSNISYEVLPNRLSVFTAVTNILDKDFYENIGYSARGRNFKLGINLKF
ncbi:TonB-dependent receptor plug domain-containing protein [Flavobacterium sp.]|uniref:TonB-dependent receptor plug domain-containing protein n=1 Tax=Flavobacterium sp. TaxID=239 RepID=UPI001B514623|nr:TonB-dependent receptor plug domain-containing protein [Flavobacterium sp.]MBP6127834.1 TonB-dependent receptor [Flavobacterium sp.]